MSEHRYHVGQLVKLTQRFPNPEETAVYEVVRLMPVTENGEPHYRVKATSGIERAASESQLSSVVAAG